MSVALRSLRVPLLIALTLWPRTVMGQNAAQLPFEAIKAKLAGVRISAGPEASEVTRSPWGPELYRSNVDLVVVVVTRDAEGSGFIVSSNCEILTNWHVVKDKTLVWVIFRPLSPRTYEDLTEKDLWRSRVRRRDQTHDLALLQMDQCPREKRDKFIPVENPDRIEVGQDVFAIGHPEGLHWTYTEGVISQIRPRHRWEIGAYRYIATVIQTQTPIGYGSSGGPLINREGRVVGVMSNTLVSDTTGFNFAIAGHEVKAFLGR